LHSTPAVSRQQILAAGKCPVRRLTAQILDRGLTCYRIGDPRGVYPILDATGSTLAPGRWNKVGSPVIYTSEHFSTALIEKLVRGSGALPPNQHFIEITVPRGSTYEVFSPPALPGWDAMPATVSTLFGEKWCGEKRSLILIVPSVVARIERNILINPNHPDALGLGGSPQGTHYETRLLNLSMPGWHVVDVGPVAGLVFS
jgi:RES domain-containing protein